MDLKSSHNTSRWGVASLESQHCSHNTSRSGASRSVKVGLCGARVVAGRIVMEGYGGAKQQHTFTVSNTGLEAQKTTEKRIIVPHFCPERRFA
ncbi:hypothetical protein ACS0TY_028671 [Phlomoides rotata]